MTEEQKRRTAGEAITDVFVVACGLEELARRLDPENPGLAAIVQCLSDKLTCAGCDLEKQGGAA